MPKVGSICPLQVHGQRAAVQRSGRKVPSWMQVTPRVACVVWCVTMLVACVVWCVTMLVACVVWCVTMLVACVVCYSACGVCGMLLRVWRVWYVTPRMACVVRRVVL